MLANPTALAARHFIRASAARTSPAAAAAVFALSQQTTTVRGYATPAGPPPKGFRLAPPKKWDEDPEPTFDKLGKYFLLSEMTRGMYLLLEQFFRPPYVVAAPSCMV